MGITCQEHIDRLNFPCIRARGTQNAHDRMCVSVQAVLRHCEQGNLYEKMRPYEYMTPHYVNILLPSRY